MEIIYTHTQLVPALIRSLLEQLFPQRKVYLWDFISEPPAGWDDQDEKTIVCNSEFDSRLIEFNNRLTVYRFPTEGEDERALYIAQKLSIAINAQTLTAYTHPFYPTDPYYSIVFDCGTSFLADDSNSDVGDRSGLKVKIIEAWQLPDYRFDKSGNLLRQGG